MNMQTLERTGNEHKISGGGIEYQSLGFAATAGTFSRQ
jgi:hypothetical protein